MSRFNLICFKASQVLFRVAFASWLLKEFRLTKGKIGEYEDEVLCEWSLEQFRLYSLFE